MRKNHKNLVVVILAIVLLFVVSGLSQSFSRSSDDSLNPYKNERLGFSIGLPKFIDTIDFDSFEGKKIKTPVAAYEDPQSNSVFIAPTHYYETGYNEFYSGQNISSKFLKTDLSALLNNYPIFVWKIEIKNISQNEINSLVKEKIGPDCKFAGLKSTSVDGLYDVTFEVEPLSVVLPDEPDWRCGNSSFVIKYAPQINKIAFWHLGQESHYSVGDNQSYKAFDLEMVESFRFIY